MLRCLAVVMTFLMLMACAHISEQSWKSEQNQAQLQSIRPHWKVGGKFSIYSPEIRPVSANMLWCQQDENYYIKAIAPFGISWLEVIGQGEYAQVRDSSNLTVRRGRLMDFLSESDTAKWQWSAKSMSYWMVGLPAPGMDYLHEWQGKESVLKQGDWKIRYTYQIVDKVILPQKIKFLRLTPPRATVTLFLNRWQYRLISPCQTSWKPH